ncbi:hypothetical protein PAXINDRAFT_156632 [Paxillus involutus ATCC 200175]|uniref:Uncharacterized protein n=1 Tax=Paxillus involutus ATCC 200175 TaxID=664439 RepID=A0A0C9TCA5_PAXIN|nr:hypothetical protein PAXINDRAFT_14063 [Paxillus involutus ATCC 200175]KIJ13165.1 hypothetical protein PAXINDRAFT_156632 [Paxillus involutus ATCC 200175]
MSHPPGPPLEAHNFIDLTADADSELLLPQECHSTNIVIDLTQDSLSDRGSSCHNGASRHPSPSPSGVSQELERPISQDVLKHSPHVTQAKCSNSGPSNSLPAHGDLDLEQGEVHHIDIGITSQIGLNTLLAEMGNSHGFQLDIVRRVYMECSGLAETDEILRAMQEAANEEQSREIWRWSKKRKVD